MTEKLKVLILEDVPTDAELVERELRKAKLGFSSKRVETREDFIKALQDFASDIILSDYKLPQFDGMAALELKKELAPNIPFIIVTGSMNEETAVDCMKAGAEDYVIKGHLARLGPAVKGALESKRVKEEKERLEKALWTSAREWRATFDAINDPVVLMDLEGRIRRCNKAMANLFEKPFNDIIGRNCCSLMHGTSGPIEGCPMVRMRESQRRETLVLSIGDQWFNIVADPLFDENGSLIGAVHGMADITERKKAEAEMAALQEQLRQSQKMEAIGQLAGGIAHDFNNLLNIMQGHSQFALMSLKEDDPFRKSFEAIEKAAMKSVNLVRQILAFSRRQVMEMIVLDLNDLLRGLEKMLRRMIGEDIELLTVVADDLGRVRADPGQIEQVVFNLAINARDAMAQGGKLTIETANVELDEAYAHNHVAVTPGRYVMLAVSDTGIGMTPEVRDRVFEPFFTTKEKGKGTGLGLSTVYGIAKQSGGNIWVYSEPGQGTTFKIYLPRVDKAPEEIKRKAEGGELPQGWETILVVEDEEEVRKLAVLVLQKQGYRVLEAAQGGDALLICEQHKDPIRLMLTDVVMPRMSGRELAERLASLHPEMKVLYMSGYTDNAIVHHGILEEGVNFIPKPFTLDGLARKVREVLDKDPNTQVRKNGS